MILFYFQMGWKDSRDWCWKKGMQLASLKTLSEIEAVAEELEKRTSSNENQKRVRF